MHRIDAFVGQLSDDISCDINYIGITAEAADHRVGTRAAIKQIVTSSAGKGVGRIIPNNGVGTRATDGIFNGHTNRNRDITDQAADAGEGPCAQIDSLILTIARKVERVGPACIPDAEDNRSCDSIDRRRKPVAIRRGIKAIDRIARTGGHVGTV